ncbi:MAG: tRNA uridine-5-carboxymethylaminomethyl(34) synthesis GTPase MnmE [Burkholderiales bacterium]
MPLTRDADTIAAIATPPGVGGIGVVRVSGASLSDLINGIVGGALSLRHATYTRFLARSGETLDEGIAIYFAAPSSYTGEDVLELHGHGGRAVMRLLLERCLELGARIAEPGEFTRRAYLNGKLDLAQAEAVADLIAASTAEAARGALRSQQGEFSTACEELIDRLIELRAWVEGSLDFPEEQIDAQGEPRLSRMLGDIQGRLDALLALARQGRLLREGLSVAIIGRPNVGKSSLLNCLATAGVSIVTDIPGTTRDVIREQLQIDGVPINIVDTAGLRKAEGEVERIGIERAWAEIRRADVVVLVLEAPRGTWEEDGAICARIPSEIPIIRVFNKIDLLDIAPSLEQRDGAVGVRLSAKTGAGIELLRSTLLDAAGWQAAEEGVFTARRRHLRALEKARQCLGDARLQIHQCELFAEELRLAQEALASIGGEFAADDLLGEIFSKFCIGK